MLSVTLPVYYTIHRKTKKDSTHLIGANWLRNVSFFTKNDVKQHLANITKQQVPKIIKPIQGKYEVTYTYYYKSGVSDLMNVVSAASKSFLDAMQDIGYVKQDTVGYCVKETAIVGGKDVTNPRIEILLTPIKE